MHSRLESAADLHILRSAAGPKPRRVSITSDRNSALPRRASGGPARTLQRRHLAPGQHPLRPDEVARITLRIALEIILVLGLGFPEIADASDFGHRLAGPYSGGVDVGDRVLGNLLLLVVHIEDRRTIACPDIITLAVERGRIVDLEEELQQPAIADLSGIEDDFDRFGVTAMVAVGSVRDFAAGIADAGHEDARELADQVLHSPEASAVEDGALGVHATSSTWLR